jgi:hypothetical protein
VALNPFRKHPVLCKLVCNWYRAQGVMLRKVAPVSRKQIRRVNAVKVDDLDMLQVRVHASVMCTRRAECRIVDSQL